jgi:catechol 2,3-dioxygenase-like lactoylglutathione lyase family enzyme
VSDSKFHLSLNVHEVPKTVAFLELLLGCKAAEAHSDYAKFELSDPPLVLSLAPSDVPNVAGINHLGFRVQNRQTLDELQRRLTAAGIAHDFEESVACCHSRQTKFWVRDPAGNLWELYTLDEPGECATTQPRSAPVVEILPIEAKPRAWSHRLGEAIPDQIDAADGSLDKIVLEGTFNARPSAKQPASIVSEAHRALRPGGQLLVRGLTADRSLAQPPNLPGPASIVEHVPVAHDLFTAIQHAGFIGLELLTFGETYRFAHAGAELRETRLRAWRAASPNGSLRYVAIYRGPFAELRDDSGQVFRRGEPIVVDAATHQRLEASAGSQFIFTACEN